MRRETMLTSLGLVLALSLLGCGSGALLTEAVGSPQEPLQTLHQGSFTLNIWPETLIDGEGGGNFELSLREEPESATLVLGVHGARTLRALYLDLAYDPERWRPVDATPTRAMGDDSDVLRLPQLEAARGRVDYGQVLIRPQDQPGLNGDAVLLTLRFARGPADLPQRRASALAAGERARPFVMWERQKDFLLTWNFGGPGDYDQNGETNIADLTAMAQVYGESGYFPPFGVDAVVDGDGNGEINLADITVIGQNYGTRVGGYHVYAADAPTLQAWTPGTPLPAPGLLIASLVLADAGENASGAVSISFDLGFDFGKGLTGFTQRPILDRSHASGENIFGVQQSPELQQAFVAVVPFDGSEEGSVPALLGGPPSSLVHVVTPALTGSGTRADPYLLLPDTQYSLGLTHPTGGPVDALLEGQLLFVGSGTSVAQHGHLVSSSHSEAPFVSEEPKLDGTDLYFFRSMDDSRYVISDSFLLVNFVPVLNETAKPSLFTDLGETGRTIYFTYTPPLVTVEPIVVLRIEPALPLPWQDVDLDAGVVLDPDEGPPTFAFDLDRDGTLETGPDASPTVTFHPRDFMGYPDPLRLPVRLLVSDGVSTTTEDALIVRDSPPLGIDPDSPNVVYFGSPNGTTIVDNTFGLIRVEATDDLAIARRRLTMDGLPIYDEEVTPLDPAPPVLDVNHAFAGLGEHTIGGFVVDQAGNTTDLPPYTVTVVPDSPPVVQIASPTAGQQLPEGQPIDVEVDGSDDVGIRRIEFLVDGVLDQTISKDYPQPYPTSVSEDFTTPALSLGNHTFEVLLYDSPLRSSSATRNFEIVLAGQPPVASFTIPQPEIRAGYPVLVDMSSSSDPDSTIVSYELDLNGDLVPEVTTPDPTTTIPGGMISVAISSIWLTVHTDDSEFDEYNLPVVVNPAPTWHQTVVDGGGAENIGCFASLAMVNGMPAIACLDVNQADLVFYRATDSLGAGWGALQMLDSIPAGNNGWFPALCGTDQFANPCIAFWRPFGQDLMFISAQDPNGMNWNSSVTVAGGAPNVGRGASLINANGFPGISFYNNDRPGLDFVRAQDVGGTMWGVPVPVSDGTVNNQSPTQIIKASDGTLVIAHVLDSSSFYRPSLDANGLTWQPGINLAPDVSFACSAFSDGTNFGFSFFDNSTGMMQFKGGLGLAGDWNADPAVDIGVFTGTPGHLSIALGQLPYVPGPIVVAVGGSTGGFQTFGGFGARPDSFWALPGLAGADIADSGSAGCDVIVSNGVPRVSWYNQTDGTLHYAYFD